ncbi:thiolase family protein [Cryptosporangium arvum]|uniref:thiolase family protein n=1 Tax=Cryptosporangium arvum TaxID=80871 RepID=UPI0004B82658|nr:thiolase family protein [Cryptosporangium arvum]
MAQPVIVSAARTAIGTARRGTLAQTAAEDLATAILVETVRRSGLDPERVDDVILAESLYGGGDLARYAAVVAGMTGVPGLAVNRHCTGSLSSIGLAAAGVASGMEKVVVAGGVQASSLMPRLTRRVPGTVDQVEPWYPGTHPNTAEAPNTDMSITVGWNTAREFGLSREDMDAWALRSHRRAVAAIDAGRFTDEIVPITVSTPDGSVVEFAVDEHPRRDTSVERLAALPVLHPEIEGFSITAGNASGTNDAAAAVTVAGADQGLEALATVRAWTSVGVDPRRTGAGALAAITKVLDRAGLTTRDVTRWEINEAFASVPVAACRHFGLDEDTVNFSGSGCSLGHPIAASGARMVTTLVYELRRAGGGVGVAAMCAGGGQGGALVLEV